jgi:hypothetical protein
MTTDQIKLNCQLQQIASKAASISYLEAKNKQGRRQIQKAISIMVEQLDEE